MHPVRGPAWSHAEPRLIVAAALALGILGFSFARPLGLEVSSDLPFDERGRFAYSGSARGGHAVYPDDMVTSGQPVFLNLVERLDVNFDYRTAAAVPVSADGEVSLRGIVSDVSGWTYPLTMTRPTHFEGEGTGAAGVLDLTDLRSRITAMQTATGVSRDSYKVVVEATVNRVVTGNGASVPGVFVARLEFQLDQREMRLAARGESSLTSAQGGLLSVPATKPNVVDVAGRSLPVAALRGFALGLTVLVGALWVAWFRRTSAEDEVSLIERRYRSSLLPLRTTDLPMGCILDVKSMSALARVRGQCGCADAARTGRRVPLHRRRPGLSVHRRASRRQHHLRHRPVGCGEPALCRHFRECPFGPSTVGGRSGSRTDGRKPG